MGVWAFLIRERILKYSAAVIESGWVGTSFEQCIVAAEARAADDVGWWDGRFSAGDLADVFGSEALAYTELTNRRAVVDPPSHYERMSHDETMVARRALRTIEIQTLWQEVRREIMAETPARMLPAMKAALPAAVLH